MYKQQRQDLMPLHKTFHIMRLQASLETEELLWVLQDGENRQTVFMENFSDELFEHMVALANTDGGRIIIGVDADGESTGLELANYDHWFEKTPDIAPAIRYSTFMGNVVHSEHVVFIVAVEIGARKPYRYKGEAFYRPTFETVLMSDEDIVSWEEDTASLLSGECDIDAGVSLIGTGDCDIPSSKLSNQSVRYLEEVDEPDDYSEEEDLSYDDKDEDTPPPLFGCIPDIANVGKKSFQTIQELSRTGLFLNKTQQVMVECLCSHPFITYQELAKKVRLHKSSVQRHMDELQSRGVIKRKGSLRNGFWLVKGHDYKVK